MSKSYWHHRGLQICPTCGSPFICHHNNHCPEWQNGKCECDTCDPSRRLDGDCHTIIKDGPINQRETVVFT